MEGVLNRRGNPTRPFVTPAVLFSLESLSTHRADHLLPHGASKMLIYPSLSRSLEEGEE